jgi:NAD(P)-dependent dehydrogenase (short-subunit alcohol dehydrogenase family)
MSDLPVAIITGGAGGMGVACANLFAKTHQLLLCDVSKDKLETHSNRLRQQGVTVHTALADVSKPDDVAALVTTAANAGQIKAVVHTAGLSPNMADGKVVMEVNLLGTALLLDALAAHMSNGATAVCIASQAGTFANAQVPAELKALLAEPLADGFMSQMDAFGILASSESAYGVGKLGVQLLVQKLALEWGQRNARIVSISPGMIATPMIELETRLNTEILEILKSTPLSRTGQPEEIAQVARFLCSADASYVTGVDWLVDGGSTHQILSRMAAGEVEMKMT